MSKTALFGYFFDVQLRGVETSRKNPYDEPADPPAACSAPDFTLKKRNTR
jgi:hypothetical protein